MNSMTVKLVEQLDKSVQDFIQKNALTLDNKSISVIPARVFPVKPVAEVMQHSGGIKYTLEFRAYLADEPYRSTTGYGTEETKGISAHTEQ